MASKYCPGYCSPACADGTCPNTIAEEYYEYGLDLPYVKCKDCSPKRGNCDDDCIFRGTPECVNEEASDGK